MTERPFAIALIVDELIVAGVSLCTVDMAEALTRIGYEVTLIVLRKPVAQVRWRERLSVIVLDPPGSLKSLAKLLNEFDAVIVSNGIAMPFAFEAARHTTKPVLMEWLHGEVKARQCPSVDFTVAVSETIFRSMQPAAGDLYVPNGIDLSRFRPQEHRKSERVRLIQIAREWKMMEPDLAVLGPDLVREGWPVEVHIVGKDGLSSEHVHFHGVKRDVTPLLKGADILLHMARLESFGMPAIEAMACGVLPIVSNIGGLPFSVLHGVTGCVVEFGDTATVRRTIADWVQKMGADHPDIRRMRELGLQRIRDHFDILSAARCLGRVLEEKSQHSPRKNRSDRYPFSFVAPTLDFLLARHDHYLAALADILNAPDLTEPWELWRRFVGELGPEWAGASAETWGFLGAVYSRMILESRESPGQKRPIFCFWLALVALELNQYDRVFEFLGRGTTGPASEENPLPGPAVGAPIFGLEILVLGLRGIEIPRELKEAGDHIRRGYFRNDLQMVAGWKLDISLLKELLRAADHLAILPLLENQSGISRIQSSL